MIWLILLIFAAVLLVFLRKKPVEKIKQQSSGIEPVRMATQPVGDDSENDEILAVFTAAIAEFEGASDIQVIKITPSRNWLLTARQSLMYRRL
jgi:hypothetical protein